jgi:hypothetical protein
MNQRPRLKSRQKEVAKLLEKRKAPAHISKKEHVTKKVKKGLTD